MIIFVKCYNCPKTYQKGVKVDIETIKREYETTKTSYKALATKYETHYKKIERMAKKGNWIKFNAKPKAGTPPPQQPQKPIEKVNINTVKMVANIKALLHQHYMNVDDISIELYIHSYLSFKQLEKEVESEGMFITSEKTSKLYANPKVNMMQMYSNNLMSIGKELGLTVSSRIKMQIKKEETKKKSLWDLVTGKGDNEEEEVIKEGRLDYKNKEDIPPQLLKDFECDFMEQDSWKRYVRIKLDKALTDKELDKYGLGDSDLGFGYQELYIL